MKKKLVIFAAVLLTVLLATFGWWKHLHPVSRAALNEFNASSDLPYGLATPEALLGDTSDFEEWPGYGGYQLKNGDISFWVSGYPDVLDDGHVTQYDIKTAKYHIFGLRVGDNVGEVDATLREFGYHWDNGNNTRPAGYAKGGIRIVISEVGTGCVSEFSVSLQTTNRHHVWF